MQQTPPPCADYDWLLAWTEWSMQHDRLEAVFPFDAFLQRSGADRRTWSLDFLSWKCEQLASRGRWYEARLEQQVDRADVRVVMDR